LSYLIIYILFIGGHELERAFGHWSTVKRALIPFSAVKWSVNLHWWMDVVRGVWKANLERACEFQL